MNNCKGKRKDNKKCKRKCKGKFCYQHNKRGGIKQKKGRFIVEIESKNILQKPKKGRFNVKKDFGNVSFEEVVEVKKIRNNDCPKKNRPKLKRKKDNLKKGEKATYKKYCPKHQGNTYYTRNGFLCCQ
jgi:tRNA(Phe) wybutosine-synthesizing methylase Tyw3